MISVHAAGGELPRVWREIRSGDENWQQATESETWDGISAGEYDGQK